MKYEVHHYHHFPVMDKMLMLSPMGMMLLAVEAAEEVKERKRKRKAKVEEEDD